MVSTTSDLYLLRGRDSYKPAKATLASETTATATAIETAQASEFDTLCLNQLQA